MISSARKGRTWSQPLKTILHRFRQGEKGCCGAGDPKERTREAYGASGGLLTTRPMLELAGDGSGKKAVLEGTLEVGTSKNEFFDQVYL